MKISVSSYGFCGLVNSGEMTQLDIVKAVKELGADAIEFAYIVPHDGSTEEEYAQKLRLEADKQGIEISSFVFGADFINGCEGRSVEEQIPHIKRMIDIAEILGAKFVRHDVLYSLGNCRSFDLALPTLAKAIRETSEYAATKGIVVTVENHGHILQDPDKIERLYNAVDHENFGILTDFANFMLNDVDPVYAVSQLARYVRLAHVKDVYFKSGDTADFPGEGYIITRGGNYIKGSPVGHGCISISRCLKILERAGFDGYLTVEYECKENPFDGIKISIDNLRRYVSNNQKIKID